MGVTIKVTFVNENNELRDNLGKSITFDDPVRIKYIKRFKNCEVLSERTVKFPNPNVFKGIRLPWSRVTVVPLLLFLTLINRVRRIGANIVL